MGRNGKWDGFFAVMVIVAVIEMAHGVPLLAGFVVLQQTEARLIKNYKKIVCNNSPPLQSEERKDIVWLQELMSGKINGIYIYILQLL